jgi:hypothetical protein
MSDRTFTLDEAHSLLPVLESLLRTAIHGKKVMEDVEGEMQELNHRIFLNGGTHVDVVSVARRKAERAKAEQRAKDALLEDGRKLNHALARHRRRFRRPQAHRRTDRPQTNELVH